MKTMVRMKKIEEKKCLPNWQQSKTFFFVCFNSLNYKKKETREEWSALFSLFLFCVKLPNFKFILVFKNLWHIEIIHKIGHYLFKKKKVPTQNYYY